MTEIVVMRLEYEREKTLEQIRRLESQIETLKEKLIEKEAEIERIKEGFYEFVPMGWVFILSFIHQGIRPVTFWAYPGLQLSGVVFSS